MQQYFFKKCVKLIEQGSNRGGKRMKIIKRDGHVVDYSPDKIALAIGKANAEVREEDRVSDIQIKNIIKYIEIIYLLFESCFS